MMILRCVAEVDEFDIRNRSTAIRAAKCCTFEDEVGSFEDEALYFCTSFEYKSLLPFVMRHANISTLHYQASWPWKEIL